MSRTKFLLRMISALFIIILLTGCAENMNRVESKRPHFTGTVYNVTVGYVTVSVDTDDELYRDHPVLQVSLNVELYEDSTLNLVAGDRVTVYYDEITIENGIPQPVTVYAIKLAG